MKRRSARSLRSLSYAQGMNETHVLVSGGQPRNPLGRNTLYIRALNVCMIVYTLGLQPCLR